MAAKMELRKLNKMSFVEYECGAYYYDEREALVCAPMNADDTVAYEDEIIVADFDIPLSAEILNRIEALLS